MPRMTAQCLQIGERVVGSYYGRAFSGVITAKSILSASRVAYDIRLDLPIETTTGLREVLCMVQDVRDDMQGLDGHYIELSDATEVSNGLG